MAEFSPVYTLRRTQRVVRNVGWDKRIINGENQARQTQDRWYFDGDPHSRLGVKSEGPGKVRDVRAAPGTRKYLAKVGKPNKQLFLPS